MDQGTTDCDLFVQINPTGALGKDLGLFMHQLARRGDAGDTGDSQALPAPASDRQITLSAFAVEDDSEGGDCSDDTFTVTLRVSTTTFQD